MMQLRWQTERFSRLLSVRIWTLFFVACLALPGCVILPYKPGSEETLSDEVRLPTDEMLATVGPRKLIEEVSEAISSEAARIEIVDPIVFRDVAFPDGDWRVSRLLNQGNGRRIFDELGVKYVVLLGKLEESTSDEHGDVIIYIGFYGAASAKMEARLSAIVFDLQNERLLYDISSKAVGTAGGLGFFYGLFVVPDSEASAVEGLGEKIAATLLEETELDGLRIAVLAMEPMDVGTQRQLLKNRLDSGDDSQDLKSELARLGDSETLEKLASQGDKQAAMYLQTISGNVRPVYRLAEKGDEDAQAIVAEIEAKKSKEQREQEATVAERAKAGDPLAQWQMYKRESTTEPLAWLCRAADGGQPYARYRLGLLYELGIEGVDEDSARALMWYELSGRSGHPWAANKAKRLRKASTAYNVKKSADLLMHWRRGECEELLPREK